MKEKRGISQFGELVKKKTLTLINNNKQQINYNNDGHKFK
jgi:hypothetical protein